MKIFALLLIRLYQRFLSPIKGFSCAYRVYTGGDSCSGYGYKVIDRYGVFVGYRLIQRRTEQCGEIASAHASSVRSKRFRSRHQTGDCDPGCDSFDLPDLCNPFDSCDWSDSKNKKKKNKKSMKYNPLPDRI